MLTRFKGRCALQRASLRRAPDSPSARRPTEGLGRSPSPIESRHACGASNIEHSAAGLPPLGIAEALSATFAIWADEIAAALGVDDRDPIAALVDGCFPFPHAHRNLWNAIHDHHPPVGAPVDVEQKQTRNRLTEIVADEVALQADGLMRIMAIRPRAIVGPDDTSILPHLIALASDRSLRLPNKGRALIEFTDVRDVVSALRLAESSIDDVHGRGVNRSGGRPVSVRRVARRLAEALRLQPTLRDFPMMIARP